MSKSVKTRDLPAHLKEAADWDSERVTNAFESARISKRIAWAGAIFGLVGCSAVFFLLPLKEVVPVVIRVDKLTGQYDVDKKQFQLNVEDKRNEKIMFSDLVRYVKSREGFTRGEGETLFKTAYLMSCGGVRNEVTNYFMVEKNPKSPLIIMQPQDSYKIDIQNYTFLPSIEKDIKTAQVRFDKTVVKGGIEQYKTRYISTISFKYDTKNTPIEVNETALNAFGFCAVNYSIDKEGDTIRLGSNSKYGSNTTGAGVQNEIN